jgi:hypothetical protein
MKGVEKRKPKPSDVAWVNLPVKVVFRKDDRIFKGRDKEGNPIFGEGLVMEILKSFVIYENDEIIRFEDVTLLSDEVQPMPKLKKKDIKKLDKFINDRRN